MEIYKITSEKDCEKLIPLFTKVFAEPPYNEN